MRFVQGSVCLFPGKISSKENVDFVQAIACFLWLEKENHTNRGFPFCCDLFLPSADGICYFCSFFGIIHVLYLKYLICSVLSSLAGCFQKEPWLKFLRECDLSFEIWHVALLWMTVKAEINFSTTSSFHKAITRFCLHARSQRTHQQVSPPGTLSQHCSKGAAETSFHYLSLCLIVL